MKPTRTIEEACCSCSQNTSRNSLVGWINVCAAAARYCLAHVEFKSKYTCIVTEPQKHQTQESSLKQICYTAHLHIFNKSDTSGNISLS